MIRTTSAVLAAVLATGVGAKSMPTNDQPAAPSAFILCDGAKGHAGFGEVLAQLVVITATAGLGGGAFGGESVDKRLKGKAGADACNVAIGQEGDQGRRVQLGFARSIHLIEANDLPGALTSVREIPALAGPLAADIGYQHSQGASAYYLEADILALMGRAADAEAAALRSAEAAPYDLINMTRAQTYALLTPDVTPAKRAYFEQFGRIMPRRLWDAAAMHCWAGEYRAAANDMAAFAAVFSAFVTDYKPVTMQAGQAAMLILAGDRAAADALAAKSRAGIDALVAAGGASTAAAQIGEADEFLAFYDIVAQLADGKTAAARTAFGLKPRWLTVSTPAVAELLGRLRAGAPAGSLTGPLAVDPAVFRADALAARLRAGSADSDAVTNLYRLTASTERASSYTNAAGAVWKVGAKPRFLLRNMPKEFAPAEVVSVEGRIYSLAAGDAVMLHSALIAKSRGLTGFSLRPNQKSLSTAFVRFGNIGEPAFPAVATLEAAKVIADIGAYLKPLPPAR